MLFCDGYDDAIIGVATRFGMSPVVAYDYNKIIEILVQGGCSHEEAVEFFDFNIIGAWIGPYTPVFIQLLNSEAPPQKTSS